MQEFKLSRKEGQFSEVIASSGRDEVLLSILGGKLGSVVQVSLADRTIDDVINVAVGELALNAKETETARGLLEFRPLGDREDACRLSYSSRGDPAECAAIRAIFKDEPSWQLSTPECRRELLVGKLFRAMEARKLKSDWLSACAVFDRNCDLIGSDGRGDQAVVVLSAAGKELQARVAKEVCSGYSIVETILSERTATPRIIRQLAEHFMPGCVVRGARPSDAGPMPLVSLEAHILHQPVVTKYVHDSDRDGRARIVNPIIYIESREAPELYPSIGHELLELGIHQNFLSRCDTPNLPRHFLVQYLTETKYTDVLVWGLQHKIYEDALTPAEHSTLLDRAFIVMLSMDRTADALRLIVGSAHSLTREAWLYSDTFQSLLRQQDRNDVLLVIKEPSERSAAEQQRLDKFLTQFFKEFFTRLSATSSPIADAALLIHPENLSKMQ